MAALTLPALRRRRLVWALPATLAYLALLLGAVVALAPFLWMLLASFKPITEFAQYPNDLLPHVWRWGNYADAMQSFPFAADFLHSLIMSVSQTVATVIVSALAGYSFARLRFPFRRACFIFVLATMMIPFQITMVPLFIIVRAAPLAGGNDLFGHGGTGWLNTYAGLVAPWIASGFGIFLCRQFFQTLPKELEDAARLDGAGEAGIFWRVFLPLAGPVLAVLGIFTFQGAWNSFVWPLIVTTNNKVQPLQLGLAAFNQEYGSRFDLLMAGTVVASVPLIVGFLAAQRYFVRGIALTGLR